MILLSRICWDLNVSNSVVSTGSVCVDLVVSTEFVCVDLVVTEGRGLVVKASILFEVEEPVSYIQKGMGLRMGLSLQSGHRQWPGRPCCSCIACILAASQGIG